MKPIAAFAFVPSVALNRIWFILIRWNSQRTSALRTLRLHISAFALSPRHCNMTSHLGGDASWRARCPGTAWTAWTDYVLRWLYCIVHGWNLVQRWKMACDLGCIRTRYTVTYNMTMLPCISQVFFHPRMQTYNMTTQHNTKYDWYRIQFAFNHTNYITLQLCIQDHTSSSWLIILPAKLWLQQRSVLFPCEFPLYSIYIYIVYIVYIIAQHPIACRASSPSAFFKTVFRCKQRTRLTIWPNRSCRSVYLP